MNRMQTGIDMYGQGRYPFYLEPAVIVVITDGGKLTTQGECNAEMAEPVPGTGSEVLNLEPVPKLEPWFCIFGTMVPQQYECGLHP